MGKPNFFIIGAPKCGTTSLAAWLGEHPAIYMSPVKEPHFFNLDHPGHRFFDSLQKYELLFRDAREPHTAVGEASVWYLYSTTAVASILRYEPRAKFIVMVRNPVEMAYSLHGELLFHGIERVENFARAWNLQEERRAGRELPDACREPGYLLYGETCRLGAQLQRAITAAGREKVLTLVLDDVRADPGREYRRTLRFLGLEDDGKAHFPVLNSARGDRFRGLGNAIRRAQEIRHRLGIPRLGTGLLHKLQRANEVNRPAQPMPEAVRAELAACFAEDIHLLGTLLGRDLSAWTRAQLTHVPD